VLGSQHNFRKGKALRKIINDYLLMPQLSEEERHKLEERLYELKQEHRDLDDVINRLLLTPDVEELQLKRFKKRKLLIKDTITRLEDELIPDILA
jgi:hypothetical protein